MTKCTQNPIIAKQNLKTYVQYMILKKHANFYGDWAIGGAITG